MRSRYSLVLEKGGFGGGGLVNGWAVFGGGGGWSTDGSKCTMCHVVRTRAV